MKWILSLLMSATALVGVNGYATGPPTATNPEICSGQMLPVHGVDAKNTTCRFKVVVGDTCFKADGKVPVSVVKVDPSEDTYFEGFFLLARKSDTNDTAMGTFSTNGDGEMQTLKCFNNANSAIGHNGTLNYTSKSFTWTAPTDLQEDVFFQATIVDGWDVWVDVMSSVITYKSNCEDTGGATNHAPDLYAAAFSIWLAICAVILLRE